MTETPYTLGFQAATQNLPYFHHQGGKPYENEADNLKYFEGYQKATMRPKPKASRRAVKKVKKAVQAATFETEKV